jgi:hypothetical protein
MKSKSSDCATVALIILAAVLLVIGGEAGLAGAQAAVGTLFSGSIEDARIEMEIKREGDRLTGSYYYSKSGSAKRLTLKGTISPDGAFTMREMDAAGKQTGEFKGKWIESEPDENGTLLSGHWFKPGQTSGGLSFYANEQMTYFTRTQIETREFKEPKDQISVKYPELHGNAGAAGFNNSAKARVMRSLADFRKKEDPIDFQIDYTVEYADDNMISVNFEQAASIGGLRPETDSFTLNYDLKAGRELKLADLFKPGSKYLATIAEYCLNDLRARNDSGIAHDEFEDGAKPDADNYTNWNITPKGLMIIFTPYQVAPEIYGSLKVIVPYSQLKDVARADGPLGKVKVKK